MEIKNSEYKLVLFGAGKSTGVLINYLKKIATRHQWHMLVADHDLATAEQKVGDHPYIKACQVNITDNNARQALVASAEVIISMLPHAMHYLVAQDCITFSKHLLTASYIDEKIRALQEAIQKKDLLFLCEMGLDPGIDHMSAMKILDEINKEKGLVTSFKSHCGGLVAPESDDNPWHYKISWNPRNIVLAGIAGAEYLEKGEKVTCDYAHIFAGRNLVNITTNMQLAYYPNRDSLSYRSLYQLGQASTFVRTTLRHPDFMKGWNYIVMLKLTDEQIFHETNSMTVAQFFEMHLREYGYTIPGFPFTSESFEKDAASTSLFKKQLVFLGLHEQQLIGKGRCSAADIFQAILEEKLALQPTDKDMIVMLHEVEYEVNGCKEKNHSSLIVKGENSQLTAMAKTVGLPLGIAAHLLLKGELAVRGLHIPVIPEIYEPVLAELKEEGICFTETIITS